MLDDDSKISGLRFAPPVVIVQRGGRRGELLIVRECPFCGQRHHHGDAGKRRCGFHGGRISHCIIDRKLVGRPYRLYEPCTPTPQPQPKKRGQTR
jgi:hypothetical protein